MSSELHAVPVSNETHPIPGRTGRRQRGDAVAVEPQPDHRA